MLDALHERDFDVVLMDLNYARDTTSGQEGLDLLTRIQALDSSIPIVVMTAWGSPLSKRTARSEGLRPEAVGQVSIAERASDAD